MPQIGGRCVARDDAYHVTCHPADRRRSRGESNMRTARRRFLQWAAGIAMAPVFPRLALALEYPTRPIHLAIGFAPGLAPDIVARVDRTAAVGAARAECHYRQQASAPGAISPRKLSSTRRPMAIRCRSALRSATPSTPVSFSTWISISPKTPRRLPARHVRQACAWSACRFRHNRFLNFLPTPRPIPARSILPRAASVLAPHLAGELFKQMAGVDMVHVPYTSELHA